jgi:uncharacterized protein
MSGKVVHFEIPAEDVSRAEGFYKEAFGWNIQSMPEMDYTMVTTGPVGENGMPSEPGNINGGMFRRGGDLQHPVVTISVDDIDASLAKVAELGGSAVGEKTQVGGMGWAAYFNDTEGNVIGLWQSTG